MKFRLLFILLLTQIFRLSAIQQDWKPGAFELLQPTERKPARTAILIMTPPDKFDLNLRGYSDCRWCLGKKAWELYMNAHPNVDCYFLQSTKIREGSSEQTWIEGNTIYIAENYEDRGILLSKTIAALEKLLPNYTHFFRTNVNAFVNLKKLNEFAETHHQSMFTAPLWQQPFWYILGYGILFTADVGTHIVNEYKRLEHYYMPWNPPEDLMLTSLATGVFSYYDYIKHQRGDPEFTCCPTLPLGVRQLMCGSSLSTTRLALYGVQLLPTPPLEEAIHYCHAGMSTAILYRLHAGYDLDKMAELYEYLLNNIYPELPKFDLVRYAKSLPVIQENS
jgi:hypothetical protein